MKMTIHSSRTQYARSAIFDDEEEMELCIILLDLKNLIRKSEFQSRLKSLVGWGIRRRRSRHASSVASCAVVNSPLSSPIFPDNGENEIVQTAAVVNAPSPSPSANYPHTGENEIQTASVVKAPSPSANYPHTGENEIQTAERKVKIQAASSPATPLSFSPSESDEKRKRSSRKRNNNKKKSREEWLRNIEELKQSKETLMRELENVMIYYNSLKDYNLKLKAMKEEELLRTSRERQEPQMEMTRRSVSGFGPSNLAQYNGQEQQPVAFEMRTGSGACQTFMYQLGQMDQRQSSYGLALSSHRVGPVGIPDLNLPAEQISGGTADSPQPYDLQRLWADPKVRYAEARRNRKIKNSLKIRKASGLTNFAIRR